MPPNELQTESKISENPKQRLLSETSGFDGCWSLCRKLLLLAAMTGNDVCIGFQQLYQIPLLQVLGVPITYVSLYPIITGPLAMILLNLSGYLCDKGSNHQKCKVIALVLVTTITFLGTVCLTTANFIFLIEEKNITRAGWTNSSSGSEDTQDIQNDTIFTTILMSSTNSGLVSRNSNVTTQGNHSSAGQEEFKETDGGSLSTTALLGLAGFCLMDIGYDVNMGTARACVLACSAKSDHTYILVLALAMAALGGCICNLLSLVDMSHVLPFGASTGSLTARTTMQLMICSVVLLVCLVSTVVTALINIRDLNNHPFTPLSEEASFTEQTHHYGTFHAETKRTDNSDADHCLETILHNSCSDRNIMPDETGTFKETDALGKSQDIVMGKDTSSLLTSNVESQSSHQNGDVTHSSNTNQNLSPSMIDSCAKRFHAWKCCRWNTSSFNFILSCVTTYLGSSIFFLYNMFVTDFLGKVVMDGDSTAPHDSAQFKAYEQGVSFGAGGFLTFYCCFLLISCVHSRLLKFLGWKIEFCLSHMLMSAAILCLVLSKHVAAFYVCSVIFSFQRSALCTVPFVIASNHANEKEKTGQPVAGKTIAVVACMGPLCYCTAFIISGPLVTLTQYDGTPIVLASALSGLAALLFLLYKS